jgi:hypothetical protein
MIYTGYMKQYADEEDLENQKKTCELCLEEVLELISYDTGEEVLEICRKCIKEIEKN